MTPPTLLESAAPFARLSDPSDAAFNAAASTEHYLLARQRAGLPLLPISTTHDLALVIEPDLAPLHKRIAQLERAYGEAYQVAQLNGASEQELRHLNGLTTEETS